MRRQIHSAVLAVLSIVVACWLIMAVDAAAAQRRDDVPNSTQAAIDRAISVNANSITQIRGEIDKITYIANDARDEVRSMRNALIGLAGTILVSLLMQLAQVRKSRQQT